MKQQRTQRTQDRVAEPAVRGEPPHNERHVDLPPDLAAERERRIQAHAARVERELMGAFLPPPRFDAASRHAARVDEPFVGVRPAPDPGRFRSDGDGQLWMF